MTLFNYFLQGEKLRLINKDLYKGLFTLFLIFTSHLIFAQDYLAPEELRIKPNGNEYRFLPYQNPVMLNDVTQGELLDVFICPPCLTGDYFFGIQLSYDMKDHLNTQEDWSVELVLEFLMNNSTRWEKSLSVSESDHIYQASVFHQSTIDAPESDTDDDYQVRIKQINTIGTVPLDHIELNLRLFKTDEESFDPEQTFTLSNNLNGEYFNISWNDTQEETWEYDVEWVFIAAHENFTGTSAVEAFAFKEPARITTTFRHYDILNYYPADEGSRLWARVRAIGVNPQYPEHRINGYWNYGPEISITNHQPDINWQVTTSFAENGKYKKVMQYFDGSLRARQTSTNLNSEDFSLIAESKYDFEGRKSIDILPVPDADPGLGFREHFNNFIAVDPTVESITNSGALRFHYDNFRMENSVLSDASGTGAYYSPNNNMDVMHRNYIPDAQGYAYAQTSYIPDNSGRIRKQSGPGEVFKTDDGRVTKYFYGEASTSELVRLFGRNVGNASHYKKNAIVDPNKQVSISYVDQEGRVVATALAGEKPENVEALESYDAIEPEEITHDITEKNKKQKGVSRTSHNILNTSAGVKYTFNYDLSAEASTVEVFGCQSCTYDLQISIIDPDGYPINMSDVPDNEPGNPDFFVKKNITAYCDAPHTGNTITIEKTFEDIGTYTIIKELVPHELSFEELVNVVSSTEEFQTTEELIRNAHVVNAEDCEICTDCDDVESLIEETIDEVSRANCENIRNQIIKELTDQYYLNNPDEEEAYEPSEGEISSHDLYCKYENCVLNIPSATEEIRLAMVDNWIEAENIGYDHFEDVDPFFISGNGLSGDGYKGALVSKLNNIDLGTVPYYNSEDDDLPAGSTHFSGPLLEVIDYTNPDYYIDHLGKPTGSTEQGFHLLYYGLYEDLQEGRITAAEYQTQLDANKWQLYKGYYLQAKLQVKKESISIYQTCLPLAEELESGNIDNYPQTPEDVRAWAEVNGLDNEVTEDQLDYTIGLMEMECDIDLTETQRNTIEENLIEYFSSNDDNFFKLILTEDLGQNANLVQIETILVSYGCTLERIAEENPLTCTYIKEFNTGSQNDPDCNLIQNPDFIPNESCTSTDITVSCYRGWSPASGSPNTSGGGFLIWAYPDYAKSEALMGKLKTPLTPGQEYTITFDYLVYNTAPNFGPIVDNAYIELSSELLYINAQGVTTTVKEPGDFVNTQLTSFLSFEVDSIIGTTSRFQLLAYTMPGAAYPDNVTLQDGTNTSKVWHGTNLTNTDEFNTIEITFIPDVASEYIYFSLIPNIGNEHEAIIFKNIDLRESECGVNAQSFQDLFLSDPENNPDDQTCLGYDLNNPALLNWQYNLDLEAERQKCIASLELEYEYMIDYALEKVIREQASSFINEYNTNCLDNTTESLSYSFEPKEHHYTLYYYDQAGNLIQTVPPKGVQPLSAEQTENFASMPVNPDHTLVTKYHYNSLNQLVWQQSPDAGQTNFWYDDNGQLRVSQNAQQFLDNKYSYTKYDNLGRIIEVGELLLEDASDLASLVEDQVWPYEDMPLNDITRTYYDLPSEEIIHDFTQENLRNRVSWVGVYETSPEDLDIATYYSYDIHGNVKAIFQQLPSLQKRIDYVYDLISGNVNFVMYQYFDDDQEEDLFIHKYIYDADNRIQKVQTSTDGFIWNTEATYYYYAHGPLARIELGEYAVQGIDYYYTLQGWIKGVNMPHEGDPGDDGSITTLTGKDEFAYSLGYYDGDYVPVDGSIVTADARDGMWNSFDNTMTGQGLYNGNISWMVTDLPEAGRQANNANASMQAMLYKYDQLHRIIQARSLTTYTPGSGFGTRTIEPAPYDVDYSYDPNGNLLTLQRYDEAGNLKDDYNYHYFAGTNRLKQVTDYITELEPGESIVYNTDPLIPEDTRYKHILVNGNARVPNGHTAILEASEDIILGPNFTVEEGGEFTAQINSDPYTGPDPEGNYVYDAIGNLIEDKDEGITISWTPYGKVRQVTREDGSYVVYRYDASGNRVEKEVVAGDENHITNYVRDASGNVMAVYNDSDEEDYIDFHIYGSSRIGQYKGIKQPGKLKVGLRQYELTNHLGNVMAVINDKPEATAEGVTANLLSTNDYYPFGLTMAGRTFSSKEYRYGFNGKEKDASFGETSYDYGFRIYNPRIAKFLSVDPLTASYPWYTPYQFAGNKPIQAIDLDGLEEYNFFNDILKQGKGIIVHQASEVVKELSVGLLKSTKLYIEKKYLETTIVNDLSWGVKIPFLSGSASYLSGGAQVTFGVSFLNNLGGDNEKNGTFYHIGIGVSGNIGSETLHTSSFIPTWSFGKVGGNFEIGPDYRGPFIDYSADIAGIGGAFCYWPEGANAGSISMDPKDIIAVAETETLNASLGFRLDYYFIDPRTNPLAPSLDEQFKEFKNFVKDSFAGKNKREYKQILNDLKHVYKSLDKAYENLKKIIGSDEKE